MIVRSYVEGDSGVQVKMQVKNGAGGCPVITPTRERRVRVGESVMRGQGEMWAVIKVEQMPQLIPQEALEMGWMTLFQTEIRGPGFIGYGLE